MGILDRKTIRINNFFNSLGAPVLCLCAMVFGGWLCSIAFDKRMGNDLIANVFFCLLGGGAFVVASWGLFTSLNSLTICLVLGEKVYVRWIKTTSEYEYHQIQEVRFTDVDVQHKVWQISERIMTLTFEDGLQAVVTVKPVMQTEILSRFRMENVPIEIDS